MKHVVVLFVALFSMVFLTGGSCDSGDFTTSYYCCGLDDGINSTCSSTAKQCQAADCNTGLQTFTNGQNECAILQTDPSNNNCALAARFAEYINIGCTGTFTENPPMVAPTLTSTVPGPTGTITLNWTAPPGLAANVQVDYTILVGTASQTEGFWTTDVTGNSYQVQGLVSTATYFFEIAANMTFAGNLASPSVTSNEISAVAP